jgi:quinol-cytochrome oxidoreductase complex cytochrome b subunit
MLFHLTSLHLNKSRAPLLRREGSPFHPYFRGKDSYDLLPLLLFLVGVMLSPLYFIDPLSFQEANLLSSPIHILPE